MQVQAGQPQLREEHRAPWLLALQLLWDAEPSRAGEQHRHWREAVFHPQVRVEVRSHSSLHRSGAVSEPEPQSSSGALSDKEIAAAKRLSTPSEK